MRINLENFCWIFTYLLKSTEFKVILSDFLNINLSEKYRDWWQEFSNSSAGTMNLQKLQEFFHAFVSVPFQSSRLTVCFIWIHAFRLNISSSDLCKFLWMFIFNLLPLIGLMVYRRYHFLQMLDTYLLKNVILDGYTCGKQGLSIEQFKKFCRRVQVFSHFRDFSLE